MCVFVFVFNITDMCHCIRIRFVSIWSDYLDGNKQTIVRNAADMVDWKQTQKDSQSSRATGRQQSSVPLFAALVKQAVDDQPWLWGKIPQNKG